MKRNDYKRIQKIELNIFYLFKTNERFIYYTDQKIKMSVSKIMNMVMKPKTAGGGSHSHFQKPIPQKTFSSFSSSSSSHLETTQEILHSLQNWVHHKQRFESLNVPKVIKTSPSSLHKPVPVSHPISVPIPSQVPAPSVETWTSMINELQNSSSILSSPNMGSRSSSCDSFVSLEEKETKKHGLKTECITITSQSTIANTTADTTSPTKKEKKQSSPHLFAPKQKDSLFWCFYVLCYGRSEYEMLIQNETGGGARMITLVTEKKLKYDLIEECRKQKDKLKLYKFASLTHIENQLANESKIDLQTFLCLCVLKKISIFYIHKKTYYDVVFDEVCLENSTTPSGEMQEISIIRKIDDPFVHYVLEESSGSLSSSSSVENYRNTLYKMENIEKPIKAMSSYTSAELIEFCEKLGLPTQMEPDASKGGKIKTKTKPMLYESIIQYFS